MFLKPISILYLASTRIVLSQKCLYPYRPQSKMPVPVSSSIKNACIRIVLSQKCLYPYRPQSKMSVPVSSSVKNAFTRIVLSRKCLYPYRPQSDRPVPVSSYQYRHWSHGCSSNGILPVWARQNKGQYPYRPQSKRLVPALATQYPHRHVAHMGTYIYMCFSNSSYHTSLPLAAYCSKVVYPSAAWSLNHDHLLSL